MQIMIPADTAAFEFAEDYIEFGGLSLGHMTFGIYARPADPGNHDPATVIEIPEGLEVEVFISADYAVGGLYLLWMPFVMNGERIVLTRHRPFVVASMGTLPSAYYGFRKPETDVPIGIWVT